ncbi:phosphotransferase IIA-like nitrogen-regulatory protein PtsN [Cricetibacter osteomyelitidis]|uniref:Phosphotransferase IIA-like nitrogen-regulatory protein PtsN n=1 Tax=Cricetibacter osteomyelitidis TaxID=1521931 RepID=A0A4R2TRT0_9PAST|nr:PTS IIA-like nitrogen regulatory protein PtsN [Cricetibacter osteomyelitidis]TCP97742.1 phosphotransferase IIA-like nitrogen-regulatory protein PtsN [Cricetibacter osteomyelitidis]
MAKLTQFLLPQNIRQGILCSSKKRALEMVVDIVAEQLGLDEQLCFEQIFSREKMGCTGIGGGIALPHAKLPQGDKPIAVFLQLATPVDYHSADRREVDLIYALLIPAQSCSVCASVLPDLAKQLSDKALNKQLRAAQSADEIWEIFQYFDAYNENKSEVAEIETEIKTEKEEQKTNDNIMGFGERHGTYYY